MKLAEKIASVQKDLQKEGLDGWLFYDFRRSNDLACNFLEVGEAFLTRRFFYWIPSKGECIRLVHPVEPEVLAHLPGKEIRYTSWQHLEQCLQELLSPRLLSNRSSALKRGCEVQDEARSQGESTLARDEAQEFATAASAWGREDSNLGLGSKRIAMEYSPRNAIPYVSKVDAGTMEVIRGFGVEVVSSASLLQKYESVWDEFQEKSHYQAADHLDRTVAKAWRLIGEALKNSQRITEYDVQQFITHELNDHGYIFEGGPLVSVNAHSADPHYCCSKEHYAVICQGDFVLIDLWCKQNLPHAVYADITRVGVADVKPTKRQEEIFGIVKKARDAATDLVKERFAKGEPLMGWEVDEAARAVIADAGYGPYFTHRTGHNIHTKDHGNGAHIDNLETQDRRQILKGTCFSIEPGIYLPGEFGVRLEYDIYVDHLGKVHVTGGIQDEIVCALLLEPAKVSVLP